MSVLCLFSAAFHGVNDVKFIHEIGCRDVMLIDNNFDKLVETGQLYHFNTSCFDIIEALEQNQSFGLHDVVISDQWNGSMEELIHGKYFTKMLSMTRKILILSCSEQNLQGQRPYGEYYLRNATYLGGIYWRVICL